MEDWLKKIHEEVEEERRNYKGPHCCLTMDAGLSMEGAILYYDPQYREYGIDLLERGGMLIDYCMFCGKKLPKKLPQPHWPPSPFPLPFLTVESPIR